VQQHVTARQRPLVREREAGRLERPAEQGDAAAEDDGIQLDDQLGEQPGG
jgi:hypothetical protein